MPTKKRKTLETMTSRELEKVCDRVFSEYVRLSNADENGNVRCITCGKVHHWKDIHNGHFISRSVKATRFDEINCNPQCARCNSFRQGEHHIYRQRLIELYGEDEVRNLEEKAQLGGSDDADSLRIKIIDLRDRVSELKYDLRGCL